MSGGMEAQEAADRLSTRLDGAVYADDVTRELYATAACIYRERPLVVAEPAGRKDVQEAVRFCAENGVPVTARGAGSSLAGQALGPGLVLDFSVHMDRVLRVNEEERWVEVEPGVVLADLNRELESRSLFFPPDPSSAEFCTVGGMLANNSSGAHSLKYGDTRKYTLGLEVVTPTGDRVHTGVMGDGYTEDVAAVVEGREDMVEKWTPSVKKNCSGYFLKGFLETGDATPVLVGSEGTLGIFTRARLRLEEVPEARSTTVLYFSDVDDAGKAVPRLLNHSPSAIEMLDSTFLNLVREKKPGVASHVPPGVGSALFVEYDGSPNDVSKRAEAGLDAVRDLMVDGYEAEAAEERERLWRVRSAGLPLLFRSGGHRRVTPFIEDAVVPPRELPRYIAALHDVLDRHGVEAVIYGHAGEGNVHTRPLLDLENPGDRETMRSIAGEVFPLVRDLGGTISGEHGDGYVRTGHLETQYGPMVELFRELKERVDPGNVLNPGKVVGSDRMTTGLKPVRAPRDAPPAARDVVERCHGCGACRSSTGRMCPFYRIEGRERGTPRAMANVARAVMEGRIPRRDAEEVLDLCFYCRSCSEECSTGVDAGRLVPILVEPDLTDRALGLYGVAGYLGRKLPVKSIDPPGAVKRAIGIDSDRSLPGFAGRELSRELPTEPQGENPVALFAGCHVAYYDPAPALALRDVLERSGYSLYLPEQACCGLPMYASGNTKWAGRAADKNLASLPTEHPVVSTCPGCVVALREDYPDVLEREHDLELYEPFEFLTLLRDRGEFVEPTGKAGAVALHEPCNSAKIGGSSAGVFLDAVADLVPVEDGCCGQAGCFGYRRDRRGDSEEAGYDLEQELRGIDAEVATECPSCEIRLSETIGTATHPLILLRGAYE